jgi:hypothetical protein
MTRESAILATRLEALEQAIRARDWDQVEFQYDRVLSQASKAAGTRGRAYDLPQPVTEQVSPAPEYARPDRAPGTVAAADGETILHSYSGQFVIYAQNAAQARQRVANAAIYLDAAALLYDLTEGERI